MTSKCNRDRTVGRGRQKIIPLSQATLRSTRAAGLIEGVASLTLIVPLAVAFTLVVLFSGACMQYSQKLNFAAQAGAEYAASLVGPGSVFLGATIPGATSPAALLLADAGQIQNVVQQTLVSLGVPGGGIAAVTPSIVTVGGVQMAQVTVAMASFTIPGMPATVPKFTLMPVSAAFPFLQPAESPPRFITLRDFIAGNGGGPSLASSISLPGYATGTSSPAGSIASVLNISTPLTGVVASPCGIVYNFLEP